MLANDGSVLGQLLTASIVTGLLFGAGDIRTATLGGSATHPVVTMQIPPAAMKAMAGRLGQALPVGNEGAGVVVAAGSAPAAQALLGKTAATLGGAMYAQYRCVKAEQCLGLGGLIRRFLPRRCRQPWAGTWSAGRGQAKKNRP